MNGKVKRMEEKLVRATETPVKAEVEEMTDAELLAVEGGGYIARIGTVDLFDVSRRIGPIIDTKM